MIDPVQSSPGLLWEHVDMSFRDDRMRRPFIRRAIATAIDREAIVEELIRPIDPAAQVMQNIFYGTNEPECEAHFEAYEGDTSAARAILEDHGCELDEDGIYVCDRERLTFTYHTTRPNPIRKLLAEMIRTQLDAAGIEVEIRRREPSIVFGIMLVDARYELIEYAWTQVEIPEEREIWRCSGSQNFTRYCNRDVDALLKEAMRELDPERRARLVNMADAVMADEMVSLPLYQRPTFLAYRSDIYGLIDNPTSETFTWNIEEWWREI